MAELHIVVCLKITPKPEEIKVDPRTRLLDRVHARSEINPPDMNALEMALSLKDKHGARVTILSMGPPFFEPFLRIALAMGADHVYLLSDRAFGGADTLATSYTLAKGIEKIPEVSLVFCGEESSDGATGQVPSGLAEWLGWPQLTLVNQVQIDLAQYRVQGRRTIKGGVETLDVPMPCLISVRTACNEPRFMDYRIKAWAFEEERVTIWTVKDLDVDPSFIGLVGSPTVVSDLAQAPSQERRRQFLAGTPVEIANQLAELLAEAL